MKNKILDVLEKHYHGRNQIESRCTDELLGLFIVGKRIYLTFADHTCDGAYSTLEKANERLEQIKAEYPDMDGIYVISREVE